MANLWGVWSERQRTWYYWDFQPFLYEDRRRAMAQALVAMSYAKGINSEADWTARCVGEDGLPGEEARDDPYDLLKSLLRGIQHGITWNPEDDQCEVCYCEEPGQHTSDCIYAKARAYVAKREAARKAYRAAIDGLEDGNDAP